MMLIWNTQQTSSAGQQVQIDRYLFLLLHMCDKLSIHTNFK